MSNPFEKNYQAFEKIDLPPTVEKQKRPEEYFYILQDKIMKSTLKVNEEYKGLLNPDGKLSMVGPNVEKDLAKIEDQETKWADEQHKDNEKWHKDKEKNPSSIAEMAIHLTLDKQFGSEFIVARASEFDDYFNHVDNVIIDKKTGTVVCGFDDVLGNTGDDGGNKKREKISKEWRHNGSKLNYGATINEQGELVRQYMENLPNFFLSISKENLLELLAEIKDKNSDGSVALTLCKKVVRSIDEQDQELKTMDRIDEKLLENVAKFEESLGRMKSMLMER